jgi:hypothetical protein
MLRLPLKVTYEDDASGVEVVASAPDLIQFERHFDMPMSVFGDQGALRIEWMMWLTWTTLKRKNLTNDDFDTWSEKVAEITFGDPDEAEITPLENSQLTG